MRQKILSFPWVGADSSVCLVSGPVSMKAVTDLSCIVRDRINVTICNKIKHCFFIALLRNKVSLLFKVQSFMFYHQSILGSVLCGTRN